MLETNPAYIFTDGRLVALLYSKIFISTSSPSVSILKVNKKVEKIPLFNNYTPPLLEYS
jgi:hypothetical protein